MMTDDTCKLNNPFVLFFCSFIVHERCCRIYKSLQFVRRLFLCVEL
jgi:hypothetical protein